MVFWDGQSYRPSSPTLIPDVRAHVGNWRRFEKATGVWPVLSIAAYATRYFLMIVGVSCAVWYAERRNLTKGQGLLVCLAALVPVLFGLFILERVAWNHELRQKGISSDRDVWSVSQFPQE
jgi:hypothetical protein